MVRRQMSKAFSKPGEDPTFFSVMNFSSGLIAGFAGAILFTPLDCVKTRVQKQSGLSWAQAFKEVKKEGGVSALFNGGLARGILVGMLFGAAQMMYELQPTERL